MNIRIITVIIAVVSAIALYVTFNLFKRDKLTVRFFILWVFAWAALGLFSLFPKPLDYLVSLLAMEDRLVLMFAGSFLFVFLIVFNITARLAEMERKITRLTQELSVLNFKLEKLNDENSRNETEDEQTHSRS